MSDRRETSFDGYVSIGLGMSFYLLINKNVIYAWIHISWSYALRLFNG